MSRLFWYYLVYLGTILFNACILVSGRYCLDAEIYGNLQDLEEQDF
jgi:hypothetical protein